MYVHILQLSRGVMCRTDEVWYKFKLRTNQKPNVENILLCELCYRVYHSEDIKIHLSCVPPTW